MLNLLEELYIMQVATINTFAKVLNPTPGSGRSVYIVIHRYSLFIQPGPHLWAGIVVYLWQISFSKCVGERELPKIIKPIFPYQIYPPDFSETNFLFSDNLRDGPNVFSCLSGHFFKNFSLKVFSLSKKH